MITFAGRGILLDIEGTTSSIRYVYDEMFPYVRRELSEFLAVHGSEPEVVEACQQLARDAGWNSLRDLCGSDELAICRDTLEAHVLGLMDADSKSTGLKQLQGLIWRGGFQGGQLEAHVYDDVPGALEHWSRAGIDIRIYSSGSVEAQQLFFGHSRYGNLLGYFRGHYDTHTGGKREADSYRRIAAEFGLPAAEILFLSDVVAELDAARETGLQTGLCRRPGNAEPPPDHGHEEISSFAQIELVAEQSEGFPR